MLYMKFNVHLDKEQIDQIASITADKILATVQYARSNEEWYKAEIENLRHKVSVREGMLINKDLYIDRQKMTIARLRDRIKELEGKQ